MAKTPKIQAKVAAPFRPPQGLPQIRAAAEFAIDELFAAPASAVHAAKYLDALAVKDGQQASALEHEAEARGITVDEMADAVLSEVAQARERDLQRIALKMQVRTASAGDVIAILKGAGLTLQPHHLNRI